jgi:hypothetical protein
MDTRFRALRGESRVRAVVVPGAACQATMTSFLRQAGGQRHRLLRRQHLLRRPQLGGVPPTTNAQRALAAGRRSPCGAVVCSALPGGPCLLPEVVCLAPEGSLHRALGRGRVSMQRTAVARGQLPQVHGQARGGAGAEAGGRREGVERPVLDQLRVQAAVSCVADLRIPGERQEGGTLLCAPRQVGGRRRQPMCKSLAQRVPGIRRGSAPGAAPPGQCARQGPRVVPATTQGITADVRPDALWQRLTSSKKMPYSQGDTGCRWSRSTVTDAFQSASPSCSTSIEVSDSRAVAPMAASTATRAATAALRSMLDSPGIRSRDQPVPRPLAGCDAGMFPDRARYTR